MHLLHLINDILDITKIESGNVTLNLQPVKVKEIIHDCSRMVARRAAEHGILLSAELPDPCPPLMADERAVRQMLVNLLSNAIKFTSRGGSVMIRAGVRADGGVDLRVSDTGIGIAPKDIPDAFVPFRQIDTGLSRRHDGTGLGLAITKTLIEAHGGEIHMESQVGAGTTVTLSFRPFCT